MVSLQWLNKLEQTLKSYQEKPGNDSSSLVTMKAWECQELIKAARLGMSSHPSPPPPWAPRDILPPTAVPAEKPEYLNKIKP